MTRYTHRQDVGVLILLFFLLREDNRLKKRQYGREIEHYSKIYSENIYLEVDRKGKNKNNYIDKELNEREAWKVKAKSEEGRNCVQSHCEVGLGSLVSVPRS
jgi:hypothetical protein